MRRSLAVLAAAIVTFGVIVSSPRLAAADVTGTIECAANGEIRFSRPFLPLELAAPNTKPMRTKIRNASSACDDSGVVSDEGGISTVEVKIDGKVAAETSCGDFLDTVSYTAKVRLRWRGTHGHGTSKTTVASVTYDDGTGSIVLVTNPIEKGPFAGSTVTMRFGLLYPENFAILCATSDYRATALLFGSPSYGAWTISVP